MVKIGGLTRFSLCDFPGRSSAVVFTQGCNFRCPFCHNGSLIPVDAPSESLIPESEVFEFLKGRRGQLDGVVISGGEPTIQPDLIAFLRTVKALGYPIKLDTNGTRPDVLSAVLGDALVDFVAMDVKAPSHGYNRLTGVRAPVNAVRESLSIIAKSGLPHEFRTTFVEQLLSADDIGAIREMIPAESLHRLHEFRPEYALDPMLRREQK